MTKIDNYAEWLEFCVYFGEFEPADIVVNEMHDTYEFKHDDGCIVAYWERSSGFGFVSIEDFL